MSKKLDKDEVKGPDAFVHTSDTIFTYVERHSGLILSLVLALVVGSGGYLAYGFVQGLREQKASEALYPAEAALKKAESTLRDSRADAMKAALGKDGKGKAPAPSKVADFNADFAPQVDKIQTAIGEHAETKAGMISALSLSSFLLQQKQYQRAMDVLGLVKYKPSSDDLLNGFWNMHRGITLIENQKYDEALAAYQKILSAPALKYFHPEALLKSGFVQELKGDEGKAREAYAKLKAEFPQSEASATAQQYLRLLDLKSKQG